MIETKQIWTHRATLEDAEVVLVREDMVHVWLESNGRQKDRELMLDRDRFLRWFELKRPPAPR